MTDTQLKQACLSCKYPITINATMVDMNGNVVIVFTLFLVKDEHEAYPDKTYIYPYWHTFGIAYFQTVFQTRPTTKAYITLCVFWLHWVSKRKGICVGNSLSSSVY